MHTLTARPARTTRPRAASLVLFVALIFAQIGWLVGGSIGAGAAWAQEGLVDLLVGDEAAPADEGPRIDAGADAVDDAAIERRLSGIFGELEALTDVDVDVSNGVVTLGGSVGSAAGAERAQALARSVDGVVDVIDTLRVETDVVARLSATMERLQASTLSLVAALPLFLLALTVLLGFWWLSGWLTRGRGIFGRIAPNAFVAELLGGIVRLAVLLIGVVLALSLLDATALIGTVLGAAGIVGLAVGFAVRDTVENYIASLLLSLRTPFLTRDYVQIGEHAGHVARLTGRATILISLDGNHIRIPNATVFKSTIINYSRNPERRFTFGVGVDTDLDPGRAQALAIRTLAEVDGVLARPAPSVVVDELGDSNVTLQVSGWIDQRHTDLRKGRGEAIRQVKQAFEAAGIVMPEPIYRLRIDARGASLPGISSPGDSAAPAGDGGGAGAGPGAGSGSAAATLLTLDSEVTVDTSADDATGPTLERELQRAGDGAAGGEANLLDGAPGHE